MRRAVPSGIVDRMEPRSRLPKWFRRALVAAPLALAFASWQVPVALADTITIEGAATGQLSTATMVCEFNSQTNTFTFTITNTSAITSPGSTSTITGIGFDLPPDGNASASGLNGFTGMQAPSLSSSFDFSDADLGSVTGFSSNVLDFGFTTGASGTFAGGDVNDGLLPGESASFTVSGAAFVGFTEEEICNAVFVRFQNVTGDITADTGIPGGGSSTTSSSSSSSSETTTVTDTVTTTVTDTLTTTVTDTLTTTVTETVTETITETSTETATVTETATGTETATATETVTDTDVSTVTETAVASSTSFGGSQSDVTDAPDTDTTRDAPPGHGTGALWLAVAALGALLGSVLILAPSRRGPSA